MRTYLIILLSLCSLASMAQTLKGVVVDGETKKPLYPVTVVNMTTQQSAYTDAGGAFAISAKSGDQIAFSFIGYKTVQKMTPSSLGTATVQVDMTPLNYQLQEYVFRPHGTKYQQDSAERRAVYARALARQHSSAMSPVSFLAERISKRSKQMFKFQKNYNYWEDEKFIDSRYTPELVQTLTGLKGDTLAHFMNSNPVPYDYAREATDLELKMWIRTAFKEYLKRQDTISVSASHKD